VTAIANRRMNPDGHGCRLLLGTLTGHVLRNPPQRLINRTLATGVCLRPRESVPTFEQTKQSLHQKLALCRLKQTT
jgi:hypothetical protein